MPNTEKVTEIGHFFYFYLHIPKKSSTFAAKSCKTYQNQLV